jgi:MFS transporter, DHA1 family, inner membrane transport protein
MPFILVLCLAGFASSFAFRAIEPMLPIVAQDFHISLHEAALLVSAYSFPYALMQLVLGPIGDAVGKVRLIHFALVVFTAGLGVSAMAPGFVSLAGTRAVTGAFAGGLIPVAMALIGDRVAYQDRQVAISRFLVAVISAQMLGAAVSGALAEAVGWRAVFGLLAAVALIATATVIVSLRPGSEAAAPLTVRGALAGYRAVVLNPASAAVFGTVACEGMIILGVFPFIAPLVVAHGAGGPFEAGITIGAFSVGGVVYGLVAGRLVSALGQVWMIRLGGLIAGLVYVAVSQPMPWLAVAGLFFVAGFGFFALHNTMQTRATELAPKARGSAMAVFSSAFFLGQGIGPILAGVVVTRAGVGPLFVAAGVLAIALGVVAARLGGTR